MKCKYCNNEICEKNCKFLPIRREIQLLIEEPRNLQIKTQLEKLPSLEEKEVFLEQILAQEGLAPI